MCLWKPSLHRSSAQPVPGGTWLYIPRAFWPLCHGVPHILCRFQLQSLQPCPPQLPNYPTAWRVRHEPATKTWDGRMGQLILIILYINNLQIICKFGNSCWRSNVTLLLLTHPSGCLSHSLVFPCLKLDCKWSGKGLGPPLPRTAPQSHSSNNNKQG